MWVLASRLYMLDNFFSCFLRIAYKSAGLYSNISCKIALCFVPIMVILTKDFVKNYMYGI